MLNECKRLIFFSRDLKIGGMEKALVTLLNNLQSDNNKITLVLENKTGELLNQLHSDIEVKEYRVCKSNFSVFRKAVNFAHRFFWKLKYANKFDFSCNYATYLTIGSRLANIASKNSSLYVHSDYYNFFSCDVEAVKKFFEEQGISYLKRLIFVANEAMQPIKNIFPEYSNKFSVVSNLIDYKDVIKLSECEISEKKPQKELVLFVGRLEECSKKLTRLIESFKLVIEQSSLYELWIVGNGIDYELCADLIVEYHLEENIKLIGETINPYPYIKLCDCVILTSDFEGFPVIYNECLVLNKPIITTIPVSDSFLDIRDFACIVEKKTSALAEAVLEKKYKNKFLEISDLDLINKQRMTKLIELFKNEENVYE